MARRGKIKVNAWDRYTKSSERLVLEEYSSCEVPAGCGGAIMRWIHPGDALPLHFWFYSSGKSEGVFLDGTALASPCTDVRKGRHILAGSFTPNDNAQPLLAVALRFGDTDTVFSEPERSRAIGQKIEILSGKTAHIVGTTLAPTNDSWKQLDFDDSAWKEMMSKAVKIPRPEQDWHLDQVEKTGAQRIALAKARGRLWFRCVFEVQLGGKS
ncbi:MAG TPA: hypothetical protein PKA58_35080 [Polyangium sp.]|nr:hypothetical protein [Polyangium sp.]